MKFGTKAIHAGQEADPATGAIMTPVYQTSTYLQKAPGDHKGFEYSRTLNPTRKALEQNIAALENAKHGLAFSSGMGAIDAIIRMFEPGDEIVATSDLYGGTYRLFTMIYEKYNIRFHFVDMTNAENIREKINSKTKLIWVETPTNPTMRIIDIEKAASIAKEINALLCVDNTFASPYLQTPLDLGADLVMHSATKYLGGHSDVVLGVLACNDDGIAEHLAFNQNTCGAIPGPQDCFLVIRGIKTLHVRMQRHCENGYEVAHFLKGHSKVKKVFWPGLEEHDNHAVAMKQMRDFGGMISFNLKMDTYENALKILQNTHLFALAESLGGVESLIGHPASMTHAAIPKEEREKSGITDSFIRLSVGIEDAGDLVADLKAGLDKIK